MLDESNFPDISHLIPIEKKYQKIIAKNVDYLMQIAMKINDIPMEGTIDAFIKIDSEKKINIDPVKYRSDAIYFIMIALGVSFAIGREYAEVNPDNAKSCAQIRNLSSELLLDSTKKELLELSKYAATPLTRLALLLINHHLVSENNSLPLIDSNVSMCQDSILQAFQGGILSYFVLQKTGNPDVPISQFILKSREQKISTDKNPLNIKKMELDKIWDRWDKFDKPFGIEDKAWKFTEKVNEKILDMVFLISNFDRKTASELGEQVGEVVTKPFLLCYYIGYDLASGKTSRADSSILITNATEPIDILVLKILEILVGKRIISPENGRERVLEIAKLTGEASNNICVLGIENFNKIGYR